MIREVHELELSSECNLACVYCPHPTLKRAKAHMSMDTFQHALKHVAHYVRAGTQTELALTGIGEAILHPRFAECVALARATIGSRLLTMATNGVAFTREHAIVCREFGVQVYVSLHRPEMAGPALALLREERVVHNVNHAFVNSSLDWAGQVDWHVSAQKTPCMYLKLGWAVIRQCGSVDQCCQDAHSLYPLGHVHDEPGTWRAAMTPLCKSCHLQVPESFRTVEAA